MNEKKIQYEIIVSPEAENELNISKEFYESNRKDWEKIFVKEIDDTIGRIAENPKQFPKVSRKQFRRANVNSFPFGIYFGAKNTTISILAVFHHSRNPKKLTKRSG